MLVMNFYLFQNNQKPFNKTAAANEQQWKIIEEDCISTPREHDSEGSSSDYMSDESETTRANKKSNSIKSKLLFLLLDARDSNGLQMVCLNDDVADVP